LLLFLTHARRRNVHDVPVEVCRSNPIDRRLTMPHGQMYGGWHNPQDPRAQFTATSWATTDPSAMPSTVTDESMVAWCVENVCIVHYNRFALRLYVFVHVLTISVSGIDETLKHLPAGRPSDVYSDPEYSADEEEAETLTRRRLRRLPRFTSRAQYEELEREILASTDPQVHGT
jgi:hypothetical protein